MYEYNGESYKFYSIILDTKEFFVVKEKYFSVAMPKIRFFWGKKNKNNNNDNKKYC